MEENVKKMGFHFFLASSFFLSFSLPPFSVQYSGLVLGNRIIDTRSEWRTFSSTEESGGDPSRVGAVGDALLGSDHIESTQIGASDGGSGLSKELSRAHSRLSGFQTDRTVLLAFQDIQAMGERIGLNKIVLDSAKQLFKQVMDRKMMKMKSLDAIMAACIFMACRQQNVSRTFREVYSLTGVSKKEIGRCFKLLEPLVDSPRLAQDSSIESFASRFCSHLQIPPDIKSLCIDLANRASNGGPLSGKSPITIIAASIYFISSISKYPKTKSQIAEAAGCAEITLRHSYSILWKVREDLKTEEWKILSSLDELPIPV